MEFGKNDLNEIETMERFMETLYRYRNKLYDQKYKKRDDRLNNTKARMLMIIFREERSMVVNISRQLNLSSGATTIMLNQLESEGYVIRVRSVDDRRIVWLSLSEEGKSLAEKIINFRNQYAADLLGVLSTDERDDFMAILKKIEQRIEERLTEGP